MFDHVQIKVKDFEKSKDFYKKILGVLGYGVVFEGGNVVGIGKNTHNMFEVSQANKEKGLFLSQNVHIAFVAQNEKQVHDFYNTALENGAKDNGAPGLRDYEEGYFAAFVIDFDGNNIEVVCDKSKS